jgi:predicted nucleic acid-binding protein
VLSRGARQLQELNQRRVRLMTSFCERAIASGAYVLTSILSLEEMAARTRQERFTTLVAQLAEDEARAAARQAMLDVLELAVNCLTRVSIRLEAPIVMPGDQVTAAREMRKYHRYLLVTYPRLDPMDALHIAVGAALRVDAFVSFDRAWEEVAKIVVLS